MKLEAKHKEEIELKERIEFHKQLFLDFEWEYKSEYSYGRMLSIARRNINNFPNEIKLKYENNLYFNNSNNSNINNISNIYLYEK